MGTLGDRYTVIRILVDQLGEGFEVEDADDGSVIVTIQGNGAELEIWLEGDDVRVDLELFVAVSIIKLAGADDITDVQRRCQVRIDSMFADHWRDHGFELDDEHSWLPASSTPEGHDDLRLFEVALGKSVTTMEDLIATIRHAEHAEHFVRLVE